MPSADLNLTLCVPRPSSGKNPHLPVIAHSVNPDVIPPNHVLIRVDRFGFSANNITYQALGEAPHFRYFEFHAAPESKEDGVSPKTHGVIPVWGFGTIQASTHYRIHPGERVYGYLAPTRYLLIPVSPSDVNKYSFFVPRSHLPADRRPYNQITRCAADPQYDPCPAIEDITMLYRPLFWTSFWCEDWLHSSSYRNGARRILISSSSSKTAFCLAYLIRKRRIDGMKVIGMTSARNVAFTKGLGLYDEVTEYDSVSTSSCLQLGGTEKWIYVDVAGNDILNSRVFSHFESGSEKDSGCLVASINLGATTLSPSSPTASSSKWTPKTSLSSPSHPSDQLEQFFMPEWLAIRRRRLSIPQITDMQGQAWRALIRDCPDWVRIERIYGEENVKMSYANITNGGLGPDKGLVWSLWEDQVQSKL